jgi:predicted RNA binding protein with dsRBD fold (UPF0201 family)
MATLKELQEQIDEQQEIIDQAREILDDSYTPEATRADLVNAVSQALDILADEEEGEDEDEDDNGDEE